MVMVSILSWIGIFFLYFVVEFTISLFFTYKITHVSDKKFNKAAIAGSVATFLFMFSTLLAMLLSNNPKLISKLFVNEKIILKGDIKIWMQFIYLFVTTFAFAIGNFFATISIPKINKIIKKKKKSKGKND